MRRNFFCYSLMKTMPVSAQDMMYNYGKYNYADETEEMTYTTQVVVDTSTAEGIGELFMKSYGVLCNLPSMTDISEDDTNTFLMINNNTTHNPVLLQKPNYEPVQYVNNAEFDGNNSELYTIDGVNLKMNNSYQITHYHVNMASLMQIGEWLDYLKENDVYDNTRIIIVSDHGRALYQIDELDLGPENYETFNAEMYFPYLLVKDFNATGFNTSDEFMTNADVPVLAFEDLIENPVNPFTGKAITSDEKTAHEQYISMSQEWVIGKNDGNVLLPSTWYSVKDNIWDKENWTYIDEITSVPEGAK